jgi:nicotinamide mononucleotide (NMN) deamidase PncC
MLKTALNMFVGGLIAASVSLAFAVTGIQPQPGNSNSLIDGTWLLGLAGQQNELYQSGITAAGTTQATATSLPAGIGLIEIDTVPASSGVRLPSCIAGTEIQSFNTTSTTLLYYPNLANNPITGAQDTINGGTSFSVTGVSGPPTGTVTAFMCAKNGVWGAK